MIFIRRAISKYHTLTPQQYLLNQKSAVLAREPQTSIMHPLPNSNHGSEDTTDQVTLVGVPRGTFKEKFEQYDTLKRNMVRNPCDLLFLDIDPSPYLVRERFASHKCALKEVEDYYKDGIIQMDPIKPISWQQTVVNLLTLDMLKQNKLPDQLNYRKGFYSYSYNYLQDEQDHKQLTTPLATAIGQHILSGNRTNYPFIDKVLYTGLMSGHKVMLGGMPESLYKLILGNSISIHQLRDMFKFVISKNNELTVPFSIEDACTNFLPHIFQTPKDLYLTSILKQAFQAALQITAFVGIQHWSPIKSYWVDAPKGINFYEATTIPDRMQGQTDEQVIQKQAILQVLLSTRTWGKPYISNPFPYISEDITKFTDDDLVKLKQTFKHYYMMYKTFKTKQTKKIDGNTKPKLQIPVNFTDIHKKLEKDPKFKNFGSRIMKQEKQEAVQK